MISEVVCRYKVVSYELQVISTKKSMKVDIQINPSMEKLGGCYCCSIRDMSCPPFAAASWYSTCPMEQSPTWAV